MIEFATLIEQAAPKMRERILKDTEKEDHVFLGKVLRRVVYFEELTYIDPNIISEIISRTTPRLIAYATYGMLEKDIRFFTRLMGIREQHEFKDELERMSKGIPREFVLGAQRSVLKLARQLEAQNKFVFECPGSPRFAKKRTAS